MTHEDAGHYARKQKDGKNDPAMAEALARRAQGTSITCAAVHAAAREMGTEPSLAGMQVDLMELRLTACSLGLFGYGDEANRLTPMSSVPEALGQGLRAASRDGRISCLDCWNLADDMNLSRKEVAAACETLGLKIRPCQLGAF
jgi:hypothetical protein